MRLTWLHMTAKHNRGAPACDLHTDRNIQLKPKQDSSQSHVTSMHVWLGKIVQCDSLS